MRRSIRVALVFLAALVVPVGIAWGQTTSTSTTTTAPTTTTIASTTTTAIPCRPIGSPPGPLPLCAPPGSPPGAPPFPGPAPGTPTTEVAPPSPFQCPPEGGTFLDGTRVLHCDPGPTIPVAGPNVPSARVSFTG